jgi:DNA-binding PadR family transcriptional regulator
MSPVFRHGGLRLYLLKLLDEAPRHGYDVIRLLQDRFLGVYSPSPGTIYPRLARLEAEGLVTHETVDGRKVYRITEAGRAELHRKMADLTALEEELSASVRDIARELSQDVRETVRSLRDELTSAVRGADRARPRQSAPAPAGSAPAGSGQPGARESGEPAGDMHTADPTDGTASPADGTVTPADGTVAGEPAAARPDAASAAPTDGRTAADRNRAADDPGQDGEGGPDTGPGRPDLAGELLRLAADFLRDVHRAIWQHAGALGEDSVGKLGDILTDALERIGREVFTADDERG